MEKIIWHRANFDYEYDLFDILLDQNKRIQICSEFEYLYFFFDNGPEFGIVLHQSLSDEYISMCPFPCPTNLFNMDLFSSYQNCWGELKEKSIEQQLNSKVYSLEIETKLGINRSKKKLLNCSEDFKAYLKKYPKGNKIIQSPFLFSGIGQRVIDHNELLPKKFPLIISHKLDRICDLGTVVRKGQENLLYVSLNNKAGKYRGSVYFNENIDLYSFLSSYYSIPYDIIKDLMSELSEVASLLKKEVKEVNLFQFDSFIYKRGDTFSLYPLVEINYRKTLGILFNKILSKSYNIQFARLIPSHLNKTSKINLQKISPKGRKFDVYIGEVDTKEELIDSLTLFEEVDTL